MQTSLHALKKGNIWCVESVFSSHMIGDKNKFSTLKEVNEGSVTFGDNATTRIAIKGTFSLDMGRLKLRMSCMLKVWNTIFSVLVKCVIKDTLSHLILKVVR